MQKLYCIRGSVAPDSGARDFVFFTLADDQEGAEENWNQAVIEKYDGPVARGIETVQLIGAGPLDTLLEPQNVAYIEHPYAG